MKSNWSHLDRFRVREGNFASREGDTCGAFTIPFNELRLRIIATDGEADEDVNGSTDWEHVSVHAYDPVFHKTKTPNWEAMCFVKDLFWNEDEAVIQFHPARVDYVNMHEHVLHLFRWKKGTFPKPPTICI